jgi:hypothetical protein
MAAIDKLTIEHGRAWDAQSGRTPIPAPQHESGCSARPIDNWRYGTIIDGAYVVVTSCLGCAAKRIDT